MKRIFAGTIAALALSACATAPATPADTILGVWNCHTEAEGAIVDGKFTYMTGGLAKADATMDVDAGGMKIWIGGVLDTTWGFQPDGKLVETVTGLKVNAAKMSGNDLPAPTIATMIQPTIDQMVVGQATTSTVVFEGSTMTSTDEDGVVTSCKR